jgi:flavin reductase (DIM6/NTAB) family NADH-FMN oxidoreductase RutF
MTRAAIDPGAFRHILGRYPTGVCVVTAMPADGVPAGMAVGSFTSVSLDPPLIGFFPDKTSTSWPRIERTGRFCVNVLAHDQQWLCGRFASKMASKFEGVSHAVSEGRAPVLDDVVAWIDCVMHAVQEAGDHYFVLGEVQALGVGRDVPPLLFFQGGYGRFIPTAASAMAG